MLLFGFLGFALGLGPIAATESYAKNAAFRTNNAAVTERCMAQDRIRAREYAELPGIHGTVTAINGSIIAMQESTDGAGTVYSVDAADAAVKTRGDEAALSDIEVGDRIAVHGTINGSDITAGSICIGQGDRTGNMDRKGLRNGQAGQNSTRQR